MSYSLSCFYVKKDTKFSKQLLNALECEIKACNRYIDNYYLSEEEIVINIPSFETIHIYATSSIKSDGDYAKLMMGGYVPMSDGTLYSGFKHTSGDKNIVANIFMLIIKYYLKDKVAIYLEDCEYCLSNDFLNAVAYVNSKGYDIAVKYRVDSRNPYIKIKGRSVKNEFDADGKIFNSMFKRVDA